MNAILVPVLYSLSGVCAYAALHHALVAWRRPMDRTQLLFVGMCVAIGLYIVAKAGAYQTDTAQELVAARRWELSFALVFLAALPWFVAEYTAVRPRWLLASVSTLLAAVFVANLTLPYGITFVELPEVQRMTLPWGDQVTDLRVHKRGAWHNAGWLGILVIFGYSIFACVRQYRRGARRMALTLAFGLGLFIGLTLFNLIVNLGLIRFTHTAEFGFIGLVVVMSLGLTRELRERERRLQAMIDNVPTVVYMKDLHGRYLLINRQFEALLNLTNASVVGKTDLDLFPAAQAAAHRANDRRVIETGHALEFEEVVDLNGRAHTFISLKFPLLDVDGLPYAICGASTDISSQRESQEEMRAMRANAWHADRVARVGALSASLAHELNQPLAAVLSNAQAALRFLDSGKADLQEIRQILEDIVRDDKRAATVISSLRAMVRRQESRRERVDLSEITREMLDILHGELLVRQVETTTDLEGGCVALADKGQIQQVVLNLVMNAVEAMNGRPAGERRLHISVCRTDKGVGQIVVRDSGEGIPKDEMDKVFDAFRSTKPQGTGLGLAVCRSIAESHGGSIWLEANDDRGVSACLTLPLDNSDRAISAA
jgi:PAS domain S-box-containing protein